MTGTRSYILIEHGKDFEFNCARNKKPLKVISRDNMI